jgi:hypothetical protein
MRMKRHYDEDRRAMRYLRAEQPESLDPVLACWYSGPYFADGYVVLLHNAPGLMWKTGLRYRDWDARPLRPDRPPKWSQSLRA